MPNHCSNVLVIEKATDEQITRILNALEREKLAEEFMPSPDWPNVPNDNGHLVGPAYFQRHIKRNMWQGGSLFVQSPRFPDGSYEQRWYNWNITNWGTKWGAYECFVSEAKDGKLTASFNTAWSPLSAQFFEAMSAQLPGVEITCYYSEPGADYLGVTFAKDGSANEAWGSISALEQEFYKAKLTAEQLAILDDDKHEDFDQTTEDAYEMWQDVGYEYVDDAQEKMLEALKSRFTESTHELKGAQLLARLTEFEYDFGEDATEAILEACGYNDVKRFYNALAQTSEYIKHQAALTIKSIRKSK